MFRFRVFLVATAVVVGPGVTAAAEREMPKFDITATCQGSGRCKHPRSACKTNRRHAISLQSFGRNSSNQMLHVAFRS